MMGSLGAHAAAHIPAHRMQIPQLVHEVGKDDDIDRTSTGEGV